MTGWRLTQLTFGSDEGRFHSHSYYDIPVFDGTGTRIAGFRTAFTGRHPTPGDSVEVGLADAGRPGDWHPLAATTAWSWQQGPMAQWVPGRDALVWNDREGDRFVARLHDTGTGTTATLPRPVYALTPDGRAGLSVNMARLNALRPGYGYATDTPPPLPRIPDDDGVWSVPLDGSAPRLILPLARAVAFLRTRLALRERLRHRLDRYRYWFNHVKIAPGGDRFTLKLRWRKPQGGWNGRMGVSLTCAIDGTGLRLLGRATSHVLWLDDDRLYYYDEGAGDMPLVADAAPEGRRIGTIPGIDANVHMRHLPPRIGPGGTPETAVFDTPYREDVDLFQTAWNGGDRTLIASFAGHVPPRGPFRCDLHPVPDASGQRLVVTSMQDGGRQIYLLERDP
ncbi:hypothetical protein OCGS_2513 [Oceaniovalibus guishaninsula JLT2003]|uniref:Uncharacterized protein n=1 Tax=Oceaniovalibus guishaninsula JLT2003 TaxID=1231392 RepID=K2GKS6_9RHOB|nr:hypothetical protein [Oceaniovalibus guishaninsula]EKE43381.1 hypothetical protein OCGS_2513 [Oceaniovalibus guishaninsula JLT2003]